MLRENRSLGIFKPNPVPLCPPKFQHSILGSNLRFCGDSPAGTHLNLKTVGYVNYNTYLNIQFFLTDNIFFLQDKDQTVSTVLYKEAVSV